MSNIEGKDFVIKGLSLTEPWATFMAQGFKKIETRGYYPRVWENHLNRAVSIPRCLMAIHAAKSMPNDVKEMCIEDPLFKMLLHKLGIEVRPASGGKYGSRLQKRYVGVDKFHFGKIIAVTEVYDVRMTDRILQSRAAFLLTQQEEELGDYSSGRYGWLTRGVQVLKEPVEVQGRQTMFDLPEDVKEKVLSQISLAF